jgi:hypothetical protein
MTLPGRVEEGDVIGCERCGAAHRVKNYEWEMPVQVIVCFEGIHLVGIEHTPVAQHTIVDYRRFSELA